LLLRHVAGRYRNRRSDELEVNRLLAIAKTFVSSRGLLITALCRERIGAQGLFSANRIISYWIQTNAIVTAEGDNEVLLIKTARELLLGADYRPPRANVAQASGVEALAVDNLLAIIADYESRLHQRLGESMAGAQTGPALFDAWNENLQLALELANVHATRITLQCFMAAACDAGTSSIGPVLDRVLQLFALRELAALSVGLIVEGIVDAHTVTACARERSRLASSLVPDAQLLVEAFALPDSLLGAPIASDYIAAYDRLPTRSVTRSGIVPISETTLERTARGAGGA
jgi:acyl-CoA oxidase